MNDKKLFHGIDLFKIIAAYLIILLHVPIFKSGTFAYDAIRQVITIIAVPFFFAASGFVLSNKLKGDFPKAIQNNYKKYIIWSVIYLPFVVFGWLTNNLSPLNDVIYYIRDFFLEGSYLTIWFLNALVFALLIEWILLKKLSPKTCFIISVPFFVIACLLSSYNQLSVDILHLEGISKIYYTIFSSTKNGLLFGFPFVSLGVYIADNKSNDKKPSTYAIGMCICFLALIGEVIFRNSLFPANKSVDFALMLIPFTFFSLQFAKTVELKGNRDTYTYVRSLSVLLFLTQRIFIFGFEMTDKVIKAFIGHYIITAIPVIHFILVAGATTAFSMLILQLSKKYTWLKKIY